MRDRYDRARALTCAADMRPCVLRRPPRTDESSAADARAWLALRGEVVLLSPPPRLLVRWEASSSTSPGSLTTLGATGAIPICAISGFGIIPAIAQERNDTSMRAGRAARA